MEIEYFYGLDKEEKQGMILLAIENGLYVNGWKLLDIFDEILSKNSNKFEICLALNDSKPVGICLFLSYGHINFFVKEEFRRMGIGKNMYEEILKNVNQSIDVNEIYGEKGCDISKEFFNSINVVIME